MVARSGKILGSQIASDRVVNSRRFGQAGGLSDHVCVSIDADYLGIVRSQQQADRPGSASDVEQSPRSKATISSLSPGG